MDIRREALSTEGMQKKTVGDVIGFVETRETAQNTNPIPAVSVLSENQQSSRDASNSQKPQTRLQNRSTSPTAFDQSKIATCPNCASTFHLYSKKARGWNRRPNKRCKCCWKKKQSSSKQTGMIGVITYSTDDRWSCFHSPQPYPVVQIITLQNFNKDLGSPTL